MMSNDNLLNDSHSPPCRGHATLRRKTSPDSHMRNVCVLMCVCVCACVYACACMHAALAEDADAAETYICVRQPYVV